MVKAINFLPIICSILAFIGNLVESSEEPFLTSRENLPYFDAKVFCESNGRQLIEFRTEEEFSTAVEWILNNYNRPRRRGESFWTGMLAVDIDGKTLAYLSNGQPGYTKWSWGSRLPVASYPTKTNCLLRTRLNKRAIGIWNRFDTSTKRPALCGRVVKPDINECEIEGICGHRGICRDTLESYHCTCDDLHVGGGIGNPCKEMTMWIFDGIDTNNDGFADWGEVVPSLAETTDSKESLEEMIEIHRLKYDEGDMDGDGRISHFEFDSRIAEAIKYDSKNAFNSTYQVYDADKDGHLNAIEYHAMQAKRFDWTVEEAQTVLDRADKRGNGNGAVTFGELGVFSFETHKEDMHRDDDDDDDDNVHSHEGEHGDDDHNDDDDDHE